MLGRRETDPGNMQAGNLSPVSQASAETAEVVCELGPLHT